MFRKRHEISGGVNCKKIEGERQMPIQGLRENTNYVPLTAEDLGLPWK